MGTLRTIIFAAGLAACFVASALAEEQDNSILQFIPSIFGNSQTRDTDGDGLPDLWESKGYYEGNVFVDLPAMGANPRRKDLFVWMDHMVKNGTSLGPSQEIINNIQAVFANAPVSNPDGTSGVTIHPMLKNKVSYKESLGVPDDDASVWRDFDALKNASFDKSLVRSFRYMIWANSYEQSDSSGLARDIPSLDFIVSLGEWAGPGGTKWEKLGTFIHELGHTLGLTHGGDDHTNYKPNYLSVMNYSFQTSGLNINDAWGDAGHPLYFDYQRINLPALNENNLAEAAGLSGSDPVGTYGTVYYVAGKELNKYPASVNVDWNNDGRITSNVVQDINNDGLRTTLGTQNNWPNLNYSANRLIGPQTAGTQTERLVSMSIPWYLRNELDKKTSDRIKLMRSASEREANNGR